MILEPVQKKKRESEDSELKVIAGNEPLTYEAEKHPLEKINEWINKRYDRRFNQMKMEIEFADKGTGKYDLYDKRKASDLWIEMQLAGFSTGSKLDATETIIEKIIISNKFTMSFHPLKDYLSSLKWDGKDHITDFANCLFLDESEDFFLDGNKQSEFFPLFLKRWIINSTALAQGMAVGTSHVLFGLQGGQGRGKTSFLNSICPADLVKDFRYVGPIIPYLTDNNTANMMAEKWFINIDDQLDNIMLKDFNGIKSLITLTDVSNRKAYDRSSSNRPRTASFLASVNSREIFTDVENRRYMFFAIDPLKRYCYDAEKLSSIKIEQVWAQAMALLKVGEKPYYSTEEKKIINEASENFHHIPAEQEWLMKCYRPANEVDQDVYWLQKSEMLSNVRLISKLNLRDKEFKIAMDKLGFKMKRKFDKRFNSVRELYAVLPLFTEDPTETGKFYFTIETETEEKEPF